MPNLLPFEKKECMLVFRCVRLQPPALTDQSNRLPPPTAVFLSSSAGLPYISFSALFPRGCPKDKVHCHEAPLLCHDGLSQFYDGAPWHGSTSYRSGMTVLWDVTSYRDIAPLTHPLPPHTTTPTPHTMLTHPPSPPHSSRRHNDKLQKMFQDLGHG